MWRRLVVRAVTSKSGLHNKPADCGAAEAYASGPGSEEEEEEEEEEVEEEEEDEEEEQMLWINPS
jgi:ribosomal protein L12E/L44/L45/RPP1/RPP2